MSRSDFDDDDMASLASKLAALELTEREQAALAALLTDDVGGYSGRANPMHLFGGRFVKLYGGTRDLGIRAPRVTPPGAPGVPRPL